MGKKKLVEAGVDLLGDVIDTTTEAVKKKITKSKPGKSNPGKQEDLFPETIPTTPEGGKAARKLSAAEKRKFKEAQTDMFADELKDATEARKLKAVKKRKDAMKPKKKAEGGPVEKFGAGGVIKTLWKNRPRVKTVKEREALKRKKIKEKKLKEKTETKPVGPVTTFNPDAANVKKAKKIREEKQKTVSDKINKYASGGRVKKSIDGIAQRGLTRAKHK